MDQLDEMFTAHALAGLMSHAIIREGDESADKVARAAVLLGRKTAAAFRAAAEEEGTAQKGKKKG